MDRPLNRTEIHGLLAEMADLLRTEPQVSGWRAFLLTAADIAQDPELEDDEDTIAEIAKAVRGFYRSAPRVVSDTVIYREDLDELRAVNERFEQLQKELFRGLPE